MNRMKPELVIDIETIPDQTPGARERIAATIRPPANMSKPETIAKWVENDKPAAVEEAWRKTSFKGGRGQIAVLSWALDDDAPVAEYSPDWLNSDGAILTRFFGKIDDVLRKRTSAGNSLRPIVIGFNHVAFDLRFIFQRCVVLGIRPPMWLPTNPKPWDTETVFDTMVAWAGAREFVRMGEVCESLGIPAKGSELDGEDMDGSKVWDYVRDGRIDLVARYCNGDVERTREMYRRMTFASQDQRARAA